MRMHWSGYALQADPWLGSEDLVMRFNFALGLTANRLPGVADTLPPHAGSDEDQEAALEQQLLNAQAAGQTHAAVMTQMEAAQISGNATATVSMTRGARQQRAAKTGSFRTGIAGEIPHRRCQDHDSRGPTAGLA
jgi:hypothetical protein